MEITLKRLRKDAFDDLLQEVIDNYKVSQTIYFDEDKWAKKATDIILENKPIVIVIDATQIDEIVSSEENTYEKNAKLGMLLHHALKLENDISIPFNIMMEKELWTYLNLFIFKDVIKKLYMDKPSKGDEDKIKRYYFNLASEAKLTRTGLKFLWLMVDKLESEDDYEMSKVAFEFIDPVRSIFERKITRNSSVLKAFVQGIISNDKDPRFKRDPYKSLIPKHINCFAGINILDAYEYEDLVKIVATEQARMLI